ncbi:hypothetical protein AGOR_G00181490 [Albula goreensis]|uniref:Uncharacterized protein n=1 Tax=Albula goreensis TaxID=1534307 RepID=A0A8T3CWS4_9TELE|nr:hypothetical protein AGOR_G00181490 [Albula goreensis]
MVFCGEGEKPLKKWRTDSATIRKRRPKRKTYDTQACSVSFASRYKAKNISAFMKLRNLYYKVTHLPRSVCRGRSPASCRPQCHSGNSTLPLLSWPPGFAQRLVFDCSSCGLSHGCFPETFCKAVQGATLIKVVVISHFI